MGEQMDRAKQLIDGLTDEGATIIVARSDIGRWLKQGIFERRGKLVADCCRTITVQHRSDVIKLSGLGGHVVIDDSFTNGNIRPEVKALVEREVAVIRAKQPA
ncbi:hypothetical protein [Allomesorhizobium alhagi]|uniref:Uncharacterized protein n=1 Tax=Mesorhizobium alhagi CCNWXJ12-2 TaxID=1107882 RepID=H0HQV2_9HYPH|nr:hypothetical protein [Mesorhizobium alhagi]EHK56916.1 hypothetical protein MAXJ12_12662 [Mesorhizobium alhagi CCNWXJ12-2]